MASSKVVADLIRGARGGFAAKLAEAWQVADSGNQKKIEAAFQHLFRMDPQFWTASALVMNAPSGVYFMKDTSGNYQNCYYFQEDTGTLKSFNPLGFASKVEPNSGVIFYGPIYLP